MVHQPALPDDKNTCHCQNHSDAALLFDISCWREQLARSIVRNNLSMRSEIIATAVNQIIFSLMFLRIAEDRGLIRKGMLQHIKNSYKDNRDLGLIIRPALALYTDDPNTFRKATDYPGDLVIEEQVLSEILLTLTSEERRYDLATMPTENLSLIFSRYLEKTIRRSATHQVDIVDTPDSIQSGGTTMCQLTAIDFMVRRSLEAVTENRSAREVLPIRVLDPSCGAGVILLFSYRWLLENTCGGLITIEERREILNGSIHGLDINRHAVAVTRMLLFFRLLENHSEQRSFDFFALSEQVFRELSHSIQCGNALIGPEIAHDESWMFCPPRERHALNAYNWRNGFPEIFETGGFDAVVSNPPEGVLKDREWIQQYFQRHYLVYHPLADQSVYSIEKGISLLRTGGTLACIMSDRWFRGSQGSSLRKLLRTKQVEEIVDSSGMDTSKHGTSHCILRLSNQFPTHPFSMTLADVRLSTKPDDFRLAYRFPVDQTFLDDGGWILTDTRVQNLLKKVSRNCLPLCDYVMGQIRTGLENGRYERFVIDDQDRIKLISKDPRNKKFIRPFVAGNDINRYYVDVGRYSVIFIPQGWTNTHPAAKNNPWQWFRKRYPVLSRYLRKSINQKGIPGSMAQWWEIASDDDFPEEKNTKILFRNQFKKPVYAFDDRRSIADSTAHVIVSSSLYLLGLLNSRLLSFVFEKSLQQRSEDLESLMMLPIYTPDFDDTDDKAGHDRMVWLVTEMLVLHKHLCHARTDEEKRLIRQEIESTDRQIDSLVYGLYGLTAEEIEIIEKCAQK